jgi:hypothetical protein
MRYACLLHVAATALVAAACSEPAKVPTPPTPVNIETVFSGSNCGGSAAATLRPIAGTEELRSVTRADAPRGFDEPPPGEIAVPPPDAGSLWLLAMGERRTAGYAIAADRAEILNDTLTIVVDWQEPPPDAMTAQVMTSPCVVLRLPPVKATRAFVVDRGGIARMSWPGPAK